MFKVTSKGDFSKTTSWLDRLRNQSLYSDLDRYGQMGVDALAAATPIRSGVSANSWRYRIIRTNKKVGIEWYNTDRVRGSNTPVVILLQYGHATGTGGYVRGRDFINPTMKPIFDQIADNVWTKVVKS